jgi:hypothetical protein
MRSAKGNKGEIMANPGVSGEVLRTYLDISGPYMSELTTAGVLFWMKNKNGAELRGQFDLKENVVAYVRWLWKRTREKPASGQEYDRLRCQKMAAQARTFELRNLMITGKLADLDDVNSVVIEMHIATRAKLLGYPAHVARLVVGKEDIAEIISILYAEMEKALVDLQPVDRDEVRSRNQKMRQFAQVMSDLDGKDQNGGAGDPLDGADGLGDDPLDGDALPRGPRGGSSHPSASWTP